MKFNILQWNYIDVTVAPNKSVEYQLDIGKDSTRVMGDEWINLTFRNRVRTDHWGPEFECGVRGLFYLGLRVYDHRHWNDESEMPEE